MPDNCNLKCFKCGMEIEPDDNRYRIYVRIESDFDGFLREDADNPIDDFMKHGITAKQQKLDNEVYEEMNFILCVDCRDAFSGELTGIYAGYGEKTGKMKWQ